MSLASIQASWRWRILWTASGLGLRLQETQIQDRIGTIRLGSRGQSLLVRSSTTPQPLTTRKTWGKWPYLAKVTTNAWGSADGRTWVSQHRWVTWQSDYGMSAASGGIRWYLVKALETEARRCRVSARRLRRERGYYKPGLYKWKGWERLSNLYKVWPGYGGVRTLVKVCLGNAHERWYPGLSWGCSLTNQYDFVTMHEQRRLGA